LKTRRQSARQLTASTPYVLITLQNPNAANQARAVLAAAKEAGVRKVVRLSVFKAAIDGPPLTLRAYMDAPMPISKPPA
jgi:hypothetical protein